LELTTVAEYVANLTRHRVSTGMYSLIFHVRVTTPRSMDEMERRTQQARRFLSPVRSLRRTHHMR